MSNRLIRDDDDVDVQPVPQAPPAQPAQARRAPRIKAARRGGYAGMRQVTTNIPPSLFTHLQFIAIDTGKVLLDLYAEAIVAYIERFAAEQKFRTAVSVGPRERRTPGPDWQSVTAIVTADQFRWLKAIYVARRKTMTLIFEEALTTYVQRYAAQKKMG